MRGCGRDRRARVEYNRWHPAILKKTGRFDGADVVRILLENPATADRLAWRICDHFMGEGAASKSDLAALADGLRTHDLDIGWAVATVLRSRAFFAATNIRNRVLGPVEFIVGAARALELIEEPPSTLVLADWSARLGQDLFNPPNVGGWPGGRSWLSARSLIGRAQFATALAEGRGVGRDAPLEPIALARRYERGRDGADAVRFYAELLLGIAPDAHAIDRLSASLGAKTNAPWNEDIARRALAQVVAAPEAQLG